MANEFRVLRGQSGFQAIKQDLFANGLAQESDCPRCQHLRARRLIGISRIRPRRLKRAARLIRTSRYVVRSDMNSRFLLTNLSAFCHASGGRGTSSSLTGRAWCPFYPSQSRHSPGIFCLSPPSQAVEYSSQSHRAFHQLRLDHRQFAYSRAHADDAHL
jgi:hypothetical protein